MSEPKDEGWYWYKSKGFEWEVVRVFGQSIGLYVQLTGLSGSEPLALLKGQWGKKIAELNNAEPAREGKR